MSPVRRNKPQKGINMKKLFYILAIVTLAACNNSESRDVKKSDDSIAVAPAGDTTVVKADSTFKDNTPTIYCCSNHTSPHCGLSSQLDQLAKQYGCTGFH